MITQRKRRLASALETGLVIVVAYLSAYIASPSGVPFDAALLGAIVAFSLIMYYGAKRGSRKRVVGLANRSTIWVFGVVVGALSGGLPILISLFSQYPGLAGVVIFFLVFVFMTIDLNKETDELVKSQSPNSKPTVESVPKTDEPKEGNGVLQAQLANVVNVRNAAESTLWQVITVFFPTEALLLVALFSSGKIPSQMVGVVISLVGVVISIGWWFVQSRAYSYTHRYNDLIERIETDLSIQPVHSISRIYAELRTREGPSVHDMVRIASLLSGVAWIISLIAFLGVYGL